MVFYLQYANLLKLLPIYQFFSCNTIISNFLRNKFPSINLIWVQVLPWWRISFKIQVIVTNRV